MALSLLIATMLVRAPEIPGELLALGKTYNVQIEVATAPFTKEAKGYTISGAAPSDADLKKYTVIFVKEWSRYPPSFVAKSKIKKIVFCEGLKINEQVRGAAPAFDLEAMYYDPVLGNYNEHFQRNVVHHEFFHMVDWRMGLFRKDSVWSALNPAGFKYGDGGSKMRTNGVGELTTDIPGFLTPYGTSAIEEDKAELFSHLIVDTKFVTDQAVKDAALASKIKELKKRMKGFDPAMDDKFWP